VRACVPVCVVCVCVCECEGHTPSERVDKNSGARKGLEARARTHARKRDLLQRQKRPTTEAKETYYRASADTCAHGGGSCSQSALFEVLRGGQPSLPGACLRHELH